MSGIASDVRVINLPMCSVALCLTLHTFCKFYSLLTTSPLINHQHVFENNSEVANNEIYQIAYHLPCLVRFTCCPVMVLALEQILTMPSIFVGLLHQNRIINHKAAQYLALSTVIDSLHQIWANFSVLNKEPFICFQVFQ